MFLIMTLNFFKTHPLNNPENLHYPSRLPSPVEFYLPTGSSDVLRMTNTKSILQEQKMIASHNLAF